MMKKYLIIPIFLILAIELFALNAADEFKKANEYFNKGDYQKASSLYQTLIDSGYKESEIYYNLGNSYFRLGSITYAILNYERAKRLDPTDDDIDFNLKIANLKIVDKFEPVPKLFIIEWYESVVNLFYSGSWGIIIISSIWVFFICILLLLFMKLPGLRKFISLLAFISLTLFFISGILGYYSYKHENSKNQGIIFNPSVYVKSAPDPGSTDLFILHEGTKVIVMEYIDKWIQIKVENGNVGWIKRNEIEII